MEPHVQVGQPQVVDLVLPTAYFPPTSYMAAIVAHAHGVSRGQGGRVLIEQWESYHKQTLRNRCRIDSPTGALTLTIPIQHNGVRLVRDLRLSEHGHWRHQHWQALLSAYAASPFFDYYQDDFRPIYEGRQRFLIDFNEEILLTCLRLIDIDVTPQRTDRWMAAPGTPDQPHGIGVDEEGWHPQFIPYYQVFCTKARAFLPDLSIADLLFNMGPESLLVLLRMANLL